MFNNLANYFLGTIYSQQEDETAGAVGETALRLTSEDDWVLVDRDSEGNSELSSDEEDDIEPARPVTRTSSSSSLPFATMEESWFLTPPPCFTSAGPIHMETSPLENLLIEHPSMSVYHQHTRRHNNPVPVAVVNEETLEEEDEEDAVDEVAVLVPRRNRIDSIQRQERQCLKNKQAQKVGKLQKSCFFGLTRALNLSILIYILTSKSIA